MSRRKKELTVGIREQPPQSGGEVKCLGDRDKGDVDGEDDTGEKKDHAQFQDELLPLAPASNLNLGAFLKL